MAEMICLGCQHWSDCGQRLGRGSRPSGNWLAMMFEVLHSRKWLKVLFMDLWYSHLAIGSRASRRSTVRLYRI